jgi:hypothetical protein
MLKAKMTNQNARCMHEQMSAKPISVNHNIKLLTINRL